MASTGVSVSSDHPVATSVIRAIQEGDVEALDRLLSDHPDLVVWWIQGEGGERTLLHIATDWPGHFPNVAATIARLIAAGADPNARFRGRHKETPLHWAASSDDLEALNSLLDGGADIEASGAVLGGGPPMDDATGFKQWNAAFRLLERGATTTLFDVAAMGLVERLEAGFRGPDEPGQDQIDAAFWGACHGGRLEAAQFLLARGATINWLPPWEAMTPLDTARREGAAELVHWLLEQGARPATELEMRENLGSSK